MICDGADGWLSGTQLVLSAVTLKGYRQMVKA